MKIGLTRIFASLAAILAASAPGAARQVVSLTNDFAILRDFADITISDQDGKNARVFVDTDRFVVSSISEAENAELRQIAIDGLSTNLRLVKNKEEANYLVQIRMQQGLNYAIRNPRREPSRGYVMISICKFPEIHPKTAKTCSTTILKTTRQRRFFRRCFACG
jgi:hypothetical protein